MRKNFNYVFITLLVFAILPIQAKHLHTEKEYQAYWCNAKGGQMEFVLNDKARVDCLLPKMAVEFDFAPKWAECIGQALYYGKKTNRTPACVLIMENPDRDYRYLYRLRYTVYQKKKIADFKTFTIKPDVFYKEIAK
jgi:hypothetical protein